MRLIKNKYWIGILFAIILPVFLSKLPTIEEPFVLSEFIGFNPYQLGNSGGLKTSAYYNLTGSNILVDDSDPLYNWSKTAAENPWCSGSGTFSDPYIIENVYIDGNMNITETPGKSQSANCLSIYSSTAYFIVRGCYFTRAGTGEFNSGIYLRYAENGIIYNNTLVYNGNGILVNDYSHNTTVRYNVFYNDRGIYGPCRGVRIQFSEDVYCLQNYLNNTNQAISSFRSKRVEINQNFLTSTYFGYTVRIGLRLNYVNDSMVTHNVLAGDYSSTTFKVFQYQSEGNIIQNNRVSGTIPYLGTPEPPKLSNHANDLISLSQHEEIIEISDSYFNTISNNIAYISGYIDPAPEIPILYIIFIVLGVIGVVSCILIIRKLKRKSR